MDPTETEEATEKAIALISRKASKLHDELRYDEAILLLQKAVKEYPDDAELYQLLGSSLWGIGRCDESVEAWREGIRLWPELECPRLILSHYLRDLGRSPEAIELLREGIDTSPTHTPMWLWQIGQQYEHLGDVRAAISHYEEALKVDPEDSLARSALKFARERLQEESSA